MPLRSTVRKLSSNSAIDTPMVCAWAAVDIKSASADPRISFFIGLSSTKGVRLHPPHAGALDLPAAGPSFPKGAAPNAAPKTEQTNRTICFTEYSFHFLRRTSTLFGLTGASVALHPDHKG